MQASKHRFDAAPAGPVPRPARSPAEPIDNTGNAGKADSAEQLTLAMHALINQVKHVRYPNSFDKGALIALVRIHDLGPLRLSEVAGHCGLDLSTISRHVRVLEDRGMVARHADPDDRRAQLLDITPAGREALQRAMAARVDAVRVATRHWPEQDLTTLTHLLTRLATDLAAGSPEDA